MQLICNADDFGLSKGVNLGIIEAYKNGIIRSTTMMAGGVDFDHAVALSKENPGLKIGVHLTLTSGASVGGVYQTLTDETGRFFGLGYVEENYQKLDLAEVAAEYEKQITKVINAGIAIDHLDSHHHTHNLPGILDIFLRLAKKYRLRVRIQNPNLLIGEYADIKTTTGYSQDFYSDGATLENLKRLIEGQTDGSLELMTHPAYVDETLMKSSSYNIKRAEELSILTCNEIKELIETRGIALCSFSDL